MTTDMTAPATKLDIKMLMDEMGKLYSANELWKDELLDKFAQSEERMKLHFDVAVEDMKGIVKTINLEKIEEHDAAIIQLQIHTGLRRAG